MAPRAMLLGTCVVFHLCYFFSIFDIYFRSPIDHGIAPTTLGLSQAGHQPAGAGTEDNLARSFAAGAGDPPAKRVVLIVADGLRADTCFRFLGRDARFHDPNAGRGELTTRESHYQADAAIWPSAKTSFLREVVEYGGTWGLSHTRVPTESRPGHVALIAGFYEDVSAVTRGWQDNPVEFDHVFNQSRRTWLWGSPDITRMFAKRHEHVTDEYYSAEEENFAAKDLTILDTWVFNRVADMFKQAETNQTLQKELGQDRVFFFLHLLGLDSNGHAYRPHAPEYYGNMAHVDRGVRGIVNLFENYFQDNRTAFVFTSDHGMGNKGAHGDGDPTNTRTPLVAWGAGVRGPEPAVSGADPRCGVVTGFSQAEEEEASRNWGLDHLRRADVEQADLAPLLATLAGVPNPVNSVGRLPLAVLAKSRYTAASMIRNAHQLLRHAEHKELARKQRQIYLRPFGPLKTAAAKIARAEELLRAGGELDFESLERLSQEAMAICLDGLHYYQVYDRTYLMSVIVCGYIGWVAAIAAYLSIPESDLVDSRWTLPAVLAAVGGASLGVYQVLEQSPFTYHLYLAFATAVWVFVLKRPVVWSRWLSSSRASPRNAILLVAYLGGTQVLVLSYTFRHIYIVLFAALGTWPAWEPCLWDPDVIVFSSHTGQLKRVSGPVLRWGWGITCVALGAFTLAPLELNDSPALLAAGGLLNLALLFGLFRNDKDGLSAHRVTQLAVLGLALATTLHTDYGLRTKTGLPALNQLTTWAIFLAGPHMCLFSSTTPLKRYIAMWASLASCYCLLCVNYELLFFGVLGLALLEWLILERAIFHAHGQPSAVAPPSQSKAGANLCETDQILGMSDVRTAFTFLLMVHIAFFGTGNIASMSSFQLSATYRFVTLFSPFLMATLCIVAKLLPYMLVTAHVSLLASERRAAGHSKVPPFKLFLLVVAMYDLLAVSLFFFVRDSGSWLDIGNSISQFGLANAQCVFLPLLFGVSLHFVRGVKLDAAAPHTD